MSTWDQRISAEEVDSGTSTKYVPRRTKCQDKGYKRKKMRSWNQYKEIELISILETRKFVCLGIV